MILIKRYSNRKLYNTKTKKYITLDGIGELVKQGEEIRVVHNDTDEDLTTLTLSQIVFESEKKRNSLLPKSMLTNLIQNNVVVDRFKKTVHSVAEMVAPQGLSEDLEDLVSNGQITEKEGLELKEMFLNLWNRNLNRMNHLIDSRMQAVFTTFNVPTKIDLDRIESLILQLDEKVDTLIKNHERLEAELSKRANNPLESKVPLENNIP